MDTVLTSQPGDVDWRRVPATDLIDFIVATYHMPHRAQLPELVQLARRVELVHAGKPGCPSGLADELESFHQELESHMTKEERVLFPMLAQGLTLQARAPVSVMRYEHTQHEEVLALLSRLTQGMVVPEGACSTWETLYEKLRQFSEALTRHIQLENDVLFSLDSVASEGAHNA
ncbi:hypothetical protein GSY71_00335 [Pusillimonas sp. TS35]|uniref:hemerythrin domain-containing protein n=1 Tax=Paracandidimonas lactea TaxID=2895524 RepID=UPI00136BD864|nr:hemerythrin domain-containing protein [Paracandidimonas lactea]MYN11605.1 hypothetical protein [Pusillimonas sp. TS35]